MNPKYDERYETRKMYDVLNNDEHDFNEHDGGAEDDDHDKATLADAVRIEKEEK